MNGWVWVIALVNLAAGFDQWKRSRTSTIDYHGAFLPSRAFGWYEGWDYHGGLIELFYLNISFVLEWREHWTNYDMNCRWCWCYPRVMHILSRHETRWWIEWIPKEGDTWVR